MLCTTSKLDFISEWHGRWPYRAFQHIKLQPDRNSKNKVFQSVLDGPTGGKTRSILEDLWHCLLKDVAIFNFSALKSLESQYDIEKAPKMIANGEMLETVNGGIGFERHTSRCPRMQGQSPSYNYWKLDSFDRKTSPFYRTLTERWAHLTSAFPESLQQMEWALYVATNIAARPADHVFLSQTMVIWEELLAPSRKEMYSVYFSAADYQQSYDR